MKDYDQETLEASRPDKTASHCIDFCLRRLYADRQHLLNEEVVQGLTFEELIGALLLAQDEI